MEQNATKPTAWRPDELFRTRCWTVVLNPNQTYLGRCAVLLNRSCEDLADITDKELPDFFAIVKKIERVYRAHLGTAMFNWSCLMNNAYQHTPPDPHVHWHCVPRYATPPQFASKPRPDPNFGYRSVTATTSLDPDEQRQLIEVLRERFAESEQMQA